MKLADTKGAKGFQAMTTDGNASGMITLLNSDA